MSSAGSKAQDPGSSCIFPNELGRCGACSVLLPCSHLGSKPDDGDHDKKDKEKLYEKDDDEDDKNKSDSRGKDLHDKHNHYPYQTIAE